MKAAHALTIPIGASILLILGASDTAVIIGALTGSVYSICAFVESTALGQNKT